MNALGLATTDQAPATAPAAPSAQRPAADLTVRLFGSVDVCHQGTALALPASRKTRALLGFLLMSGTPQRRDRLCGMFWGLPDDPRSALRWSLSKLRPLVNAGGQTRLLADRERVHISAGLVDVDVHTVRRCAASNEATNAELAAAWERANHLLMEDCEQPNQPEFITWIEQQRNEAVRLRIKLARRMATRADLSPEDAETWAERWLADAPFDPAAARRAVLCRRASGREQEAAALAHELAHAFRDAGLPTPDMSAEPCRIATHDAAPSEPPVAPCPQKQDDGDAPCQAVRFTKSADGTTIAWAQMGRRDAEHLVTVADGPTHLEQDWDSPVWTPLLRDLARTHSVIRYDQRGCGLSDRQVTRLDLGSAVADLEAVVDAAGLDRVPLLAAGAGVAVALAFAARHPQRVSRLILFGGFAAGWRLTASAEDIREREAIMVLAAADRHRAQPLYRHLTARRVMPEAPQAALDAYEATARAATSGPEAALIQSAEATVDVRALLGDVAAPTLVLHSRDDQEVPIEAGRALAAAIASAEFTGLCSANHQLVGGEPAADAFLSAARAFLAR